MINEGCVRLGARVETTMSMSGLNTYNLAFFFGPGLPLTLGTASAPKATAELLFTPFFLTPSVGGGMEAGTGVPLGAGVLEFGSDGFSPFELAATGRVFDVADDESFDGDSSLTGVVANLCRACGDNFRVTIRFPFDDDFRRAPELVEILVEVAITKVVMAKGWIDGKVGRRVRVRGFKAKWQRAR